MFSKVGDFGDVLMCKYADGVRQILKPRLR